MSGKTSEQWLGEGTVSKDLRWEGDELKDIPLPHFLEECYIFLYI